MGEADAPVHVDRAAAWWARCSASMASVLPSSARFDRDRRRTCRPAPRSASRPGSCTCAVTASSGPCASAASGDAARHAGARGPAPPDRGRAPRACRSTTGDLQRLAGALLPQAQRAVRVELTAERRPGEAIEARQRRARARSATSSSGTVRFPAPSPCTVASPETLRVVEAAVGLERRRARPWPAAAAPARRRAVRDRRPPRRAPGRRAAGRGRPTRAPSRRRPATETVSPSVFDPAGRQLGAAVHAHLARQAAGARARELEVDLLEPRRLLRRARRAPRSARRGVRRRAAAASRGR